jgi:hypothetical protein
VPFNRKRGSLCAQGDHDALRTRWASGMLKPMDNAALPAPGIGTIAALGPVVIR